MSFIYPECPECDRKSEDGVPIRRLPVFDYDCPHCGFAERGRFVREPYPHVEWTGEDIVDRQPGIMARIVEWVQR